MDTSKIKQRNEALDFIKHHKPRTPKGVEKLTRRIELRYGVLRKTAREWINKTI